MAKDITFQDRRKAHTTPPNGIDRRQKQGFHANNPWWLETNYVCNNDKRQLKSRPK